MKEKICSFCGHRDADSSLRAQIKETITDIIVNEGITIFYSGGIGNFDMLCESVVRELKRTYPLKLYLIMPYMTQKINRDGKYYMELYDDIIIPDLGEVHYKRAITERNKWIAEQSHIILCYIHRSSGGAYRMYQYAKKHNINTRVLSRNNLHLI